MYAIVEISGKQYKVSEGDIVFVDRLEAEEGTEVTFENVLLVSDNDKLTVGESLVKGAKVKATVIGNGKDKKILVYKYKAKKNERKAKGHRQPYTKIQIEKITVGTKSKKVAEEKAEEANTAENA
jgi:large subunit ribosomal protein L21